MKKDSYIALAMGSVIHLGELLDCPELKQYENEDHWFEKRDEIKLILVEHLKKKTTQEWMDALVPADYWCSEVLTWKQMRESEAYKILDMEQTVICPEGSEMPTLRCPIRIDGDVYKSPKGAPAVGQHNAEIEKEYAL